MPSSYTEKVPEGQTFEQFVMRFARGVGACITMRDDPIDKPIPDHFEPSTYHQEAQAKAKMQLRGLEMMTDEQAEMSAQREHQQDIAWYERETASRHAKGEKYIAMLAQVEDWTPPTPSHVRFKVGMVEQLKYTLKWDCAILDQPVLMTGPEWLASSIRVQQTLIEYHHGQQLEEEMLVKGRNDWLDALRASLVPAPPDSAELEKALKP